MAGQYGCMSDQHSTVVSKHARLFRGVGLDAIDVCT